MYRALYRKWRPQRFEDVVGQQAIVTALKNQIAAGRVGHAYLFTGVRGTGKTTCAKIFAKAVNCLEPRGGDPCGHCAACRGIDNGSILDVAEMDAASNNSVDDIRDIRDETAYTPSMCRYKVYIIDEVHMLSGSAFNALLKTLEEPPAHVIFILATTEIQKVPATILSRCQRYDFTRITPDDIAGRVAYIAGQEQLSLTPGAAALIARLADGALRDALSILDTCAGVTAEIDEDVVRRMAGVTDKSYLFEISDAIAAQDGVAALARLSALRQQSVDMKRLAEELIGHYRNLMLSALPGGKALLSGVSPEEEQRYLEKAEQIGQGEAIRAIRTLGNALEKMTRGSDQRIELELAVFNLTEPPLRQAAAPVQAGAAVRQQPAAAPARPQPFASAQPFAAASAEGKPDGDVPPLQSESGQALAAGTEGQPEKPLEEAGPSAADPPPEREEERPAGAQGAEIPVSPEEEPPPLTEPPPLSEEAGLPPWETAPVRPKEVPPKPAQGRKKAEAPLSGAAGPVRPAGAPQPFAEWDAVIKRISEVDPMLYSYLKRSRGYCDGKRVLIDGGRMFNDFLRQNKDSQALIKRILAEVAGKAWPIGPYDPQQTAKRPAGNAEQALDALRAQGLDVIVRDSEDRKRG